MMKPLAPLLCLAWALAPLRAEEPAPDPDRYADRMRAVTTGATVRSSLGPTDTPLTLALSNFLLDHPDFSARIVRERGIAPYRIEMRGPRRTLADDGDGTTGLVTLVAVDGNDRVYYGEGEHRSLLFPAIRASAVIALRLEPVTGADCRQHVKTTFDVSVRLHSRFVAGVVKTLRPFLQRTIIRKFSNAFMVADQVGHMMAKTPAALADDIRSAPELDRATRQEAIRLLTHMGDPVPPCRPAGQ